VNTLPFGHSFSGILKLELLPRDGKEVYFTKAAKSLKFVYNKSHRGLKKANTLAKK
jgi:hypothetical protein